MTSPAPQVATSRGVKPSVRTEANGGLKFLLVYEDTQTGVRARHIMNRLIASQKPPQETMPVLFRFELLSMREIWELAARGCQSVDILVLSAHSGESVPASVKSWILYWMGYKGGNPRHLVASFDSFAHNSTDAESTLFYLESLAVWANVKLTTCFGEDPFAGFNEPLPDFRGRKGNAIATSSSTMPKLIELCWPQNQVADKLAGLARKNSSDI